jgi:hypothetical protein
VIPISRQDFVFSFNFMFHYSQDSDSKTEEEKERITNPILKTTIPRAFILPQRPQIFHMKYFGFDFGESQVKIVLST